MTLGDAEAVEQLRAALAVGCTAATHVVADPQTFGPADVAREIAAVVRPRGRGGHDLVLLGNDAADSGDFQVGIRLAYELGWPVVNGVDEGLGRRRRGHRERRRPGGARDLPGAAARRGHDPRGRGRAALPDRPGRMKAKKVADRGAPPAAEPAGPTGSSCCCRRRRPATCRSSARARTPRRRGRPVRAAGGAVPMIVVLVEKDLDGLAVEVSRETVTFARSLSEAGGGVPVDAVVVGDGVRRAARAARGVRRARRAPARRRGVRRLRRGRPGRPAIEDVLATTTTVVVMAAGTERGNEVLAHVAARARRGDGGERAVVQRAVAVRGDPAGGRRAGAGGDEAAPSGRRSSPWPATRSKPRRPRRPGRRTSSSTRPRWRPPTWWRAWCPARSPSRTCPASLKSARVVVGAGRGAGSPTGSRTCWS